MISQPPAAVVTPKLTGRNGKTGVPSKFVNVGKGVPRVANDDFRGFSSLFFFLLFCYLCAMVRRAVPVHMHAVFHRMFILIRASYPVGIHTCAERKKKRFR